MFDPSWLVLLYKLGVAMNNLRYLGGINNNEKDPDSVPLSPFLLVIYFRHEDNHPCRFRDFQTILFKKIYFLGLNSNKIQIYYIHIYTQIYLNVVYV